MLVKRYCSFLFLRQVQPPQYPRSRGDIAWCSSCPRALGVDSLSIAAASAILTLVIDIYPMGLRLSDLLL